MRLHCSTISIEGITTEKLNLPRPIIVEMDLQFAETGYSHKERKLDITIEKDKIQRRLTQLILGILDVQLAATIIDVPSLEIFGLLD